MPAYVGPAWTKEDNRHGITRHRTDRNHNRSAQHGNAGNRAEELRLTTVAPTLEPLGELHPKLRWMTQDKIRTMWISGNLFDCLALSRCRPARVKRPRTPFW